LSSNNDEKPAFYSTGIKGLDKLLSGGLLLGENVLWEVESGMFAKESLYSFMRQGIIEGNQVIYLELLIPLKPLCFNLPL